MLSAELRDHRARDPDPALAVGPVIEPRVSPAASAFTLRPYREGDEEAILPAFTAAFAVPRPLERWRWIYRASPDGARLMLAWAPDGGLAAHFGGTAHRGVRDEQPISVTHMRDAFSTPGYRGAIGGRKGVYVRTIEAFFARWDGETTFVYGFPSARHFRLGSLVGRFSGFSDWVAFRVVLSRTYEGRAAPTLRAVVREVTAFDAAFDALWKERSRRLRMAVVHDAAFLSWRFGPGAGRPYWTWTVSPYLSARLVGYVVLQPWRDSARLVDFCLPEDRGLSAGFWRQVAAILYARGVRTVETWFSANAPERSTLRDLGFTPVPTPAEFVPTYRACVPDLELAAIDAGFFYTMADSDLY